jgi:hypothetical protein
MPPLTARITALAATMTEAQQEPQVAAGGHSTYRGVNGLHPVCGQQAQRLHHQEPQWEQALLPSSASMQINWSPWDPSSGAVALSPAPAAGDRSTAITAGKHREVSRSCRSSGSLAISQQEKAAAWAAADAATDAEVSAYLRSHWQQQHMPAAALVLQCAWRSRVPRVMFGR